MTDFFLHMNPSKWKYPIEDKKENTNGKHKAYKAQGWDYIV